MSDSLIAEETAPEPTSLVPDDTPAPTTPAPKAGDTLEDGTVVSESMAAANDDTPPADPNARPDWLTDDSYDVVKEDGTRDYEAMAKKAMERHINAEKALKARKSDVPKDAADYDRSMVPEGLDVGDDMFEWLKEQDFTPAQAKAYFDKLATDVMPALRDTQIALEKERVSVMWGLEDTDLQNEIIKVSVWAKDRFGEDMAKAFGSNAKGMNALREMMNGAGESDSVHPFDETGSSSEDKAAVMDKLIHEAYKLQKEGDLAGHERLMQQVYSM